MASGRQTPTQSGTLSSSSWRRPRVLGLLLVLGFALVAAACGPSLKRVAISEEAVEAEKQRQLDLALATFLQRQDRLFSVSYPVLVAGAEVCGKDVRPTYGFELHDKKRYRKLLGKEFEEAAARRGLGDQVTVRYVHPQLPAASAGFLVGDRVLAINGQPLKDKTAEEAMKLVHKGDPSKNRPLTLSVERDGQVQELTIPSVQACEYPVELVNNDSINAYATGSQVGIHTGMVRFAEADKELALVLGHEIAHNALGHIGKQRVNVLLGLLIDIAVIAATGIDTGGVFGELGLRAFSPAFEAEADYAGLYIVARARYDITDAANFWRRIAVEAPHAIKKEFLSTHPSTPERFAAIEATVREIDEKRHRGEPLLPEKKDKDEPSTEAEPGQDAPPPAMQKESDG